MPLLPCTEAPEELLAMFNTDKESILARCYEPEPGLFIAESAKVTLRALDAGYEIIAMLIEDAQINQEADELISRLPDIPVYHAPSHQFREISGYPMTRGVLSLFRRRYRSRPDSGKSLLLHPGFRDSTFDKHKSNNSKTVRTAISSCADKQSVSASIDMQVISEPIKEFLLHLNPASSQSFTALEDFGDKSWKPASQNGTPDGADNNNSDIESPLRLAVLEDVSNPANIGSIFRNAAALGIDAVLLSKGCCDPLARRCLRVSMGCIFQVPWCMTGMTGAQIAGALRSQDIRSAAMALSDNSVSITDPALRKASRLAIFLGNEGNGLPQETILACDYVVRIPMREGVDSLNVAAASAVAFWELHP